MYKLMSVCVALCVHDDHLYLSGVLKLLGDLPKYVFVSRVSWIGEPGDWESSQKIAEEAGAIVVLGEWAEEDIHRKAAYAHVAKEGFSHAVIPDSDELMEPALLTHLLKIADADLADRVYIEWNTYWKSPEYVIRPRERFTPCILINLKNAEHKHIRDFEGGRQLFLNESYGIIHHLSYAGPDERIWKKITSWGHKDEVQDGWWQRVWKAWDSDPILRNIHPTHPQAYGFAEHIDPPAIVKESGINYEKKEPPALTQTFKSKISVVIPVHGGQEDLDRCLDSLKASKDLIQEIFVIDNGSSPSVKAKGVKLIRNEQNLGFAKASNQGAEASTGEIVLFLNSDTIVPRIALERMLESLNSSGSVAAVGPYTNNCGHSQKIDPTYTDEKNLGLFAADFADRNAEDLDVDMLVGFCMMVKKGVLDEVGLFDERFGLGTFEDNDLSYRIRRAGYRLVIAARSYIHHEGSKTMRRLAVDEQKRALDLQALLNKNHGKYLAKWRQDLESGYANTLSGISPDALSFNNDRKPEKRIEKAKSLVKQADISLCMIVKNEERVLRDCLESAKPFFREVLVLDTGSTDSTREIAEDCGAVVRQIEWPDSFSLARTESMKHAKGKWIMWMDADDTLPFESAEEIVRAVSSCPEDVIGFVVPVRFVEEFGQGTQVDHVKVFRNFKGLEWEGRIHEQILPSLRRCAEKARVKDGGRIARLNAHVLHSGYDTSDEGQARKRVRDDKLLKLDLKDRPNHPFVLFNLGMTEHYVGEQSKASEWFEQCLQHSTDAESHVRKVYALLASSLRQQGRRDEAKARLAEGIAKIPDDPEILFHIAQMAAEDGDHQKAIDHYLQVLGADVSGSFTSLDPGILGYKTRNNLALAYIAVDDYLKAKEQWRSALQIAPKPDLAESLFNAAIKFEDLQTASEAIQWMKDNTGHSEVWANMLVTFSQITGIDPSFQLEHILNEDSENLSIKKILALYLLNSGRRQEAITHFYFLQERNVAEGAYFLGIISEECGEIVKAENWFKIALQLNPKHLPTYQKLNSY